MTLRGGSPEKPIRPLKTKLLKSAHKGWGLGGDSAFFRVASGQLTLVTGAEEKFWQVGWRQPARGGVQGPRGLWDSPQMLDLHFLHEIFHLQAVMTISLSHLFFLNPTLSLFSVSVSVFLSTPRPHLALSDSLIP